MCKYFIVNELGYNKILEKCLYIYCGSIKAKKKVV